MKHQAQLIMIVLLSAGVFLVALIMPPISQPIDYHDFVDQRIYFGIPNFFNVISNIFLLFSGLTGIVFILRPRKLLINKSFIKLSERWPYFILFLSVIFASIASAYYHLEPDNSRLVWDRLPIAIGIMALLAIVLIEYINIKIGFILLPVFVLFGVWSVVFWYWSEQNGYGNLNYYIVMQFHSILAIILFIKLFSSRYTRGNDIYVVIILYILAKLAEISDQLIYGFGQVISGHSMKHLFIGLAVFWVIYMLKNRRPVRNLKEN